MLPGLVDVHSHLGFDRQGVGHSGDCRVAIASSASDLKLVARVVAALASRIRGSLRLAAPVVDLVR